MLVESGRGGQQAAGGDWAMDGAGAVAGIGTAAWPGYPTPCPRPCAYLPSQDTDTYWLRSSSSPIARTTSVWPKKEPPVSVPFSRLKMLIARPRVAASSCRRLLSQNRALTPPSAAGKFSACCPSRQKRMRSSVLAVIHINVASLQHTALTSGAWQSSSYKGVRSAASQIRTRPSAPKLANSCPRARRASGPRPPAGGGAAAVQRPTNPLLAHAHQGVVRGT